MQTAFRCDSFNGAYYAERVSPYDCMDYEMFEYGNVDIPDTINSLYFDDSNDFLSDLVELIEDGDVETETKWSHKIIKQVLQLVQEATGVIINYTLWLTDRDSVEKLYTQDDDDSPVLEFDVTDAVVLSDLGSDGVLYGFTDFPAPINVKDY